jgi:hypothetical protein
VARPCVGRDREKERSGYRQEKGKDNRFGVFVAEIGVNGELTGTIEEIRAIEIGENSGAKLKSEGSPERQDRRIGIIVILIRGGEPD